MGTLLSKIVSEPISQVITAIGGIIDNLHTSDAEKLEAQRKLSELTLNFQLQMAALDQKWADTQADVIKAEANSQSWMARNWRPILMLTFTYIVAHNYVISPLFHVPSVPIPPDMWDLLKIGMGGYIVGRSIEKTAPAIAAVVTKK